MIPGVQISSFKPILNTPQEVRTAFEKIRAMDCNVVQLQWIHRDVPAEIIAGELSATGLHSVSVQDLYTEVEADPEYYIHLNQLTGGRWLCVSRIPERYRTRTGLSEFAGELESLQKKLELVGQTLCFHPVKTDYSPVDGDNPVAWLMDRLPWLELCLDLYHVNRAGLSMGRFIRRYPGRIPMVHFKDSRFLPDGSEELVPAGQGDTDWTGVADACREAGVQYAFAEQERWDRDPFACLEEALRWLAAK